MLAVGLSESQVSQYLNAANFRDVSQLGISIGCVNRPNSVTLTGREDMLIQLKEKLDLANVFN